MKRFTDAGREALAQNNYYAALTLALMMPDICGSLENPGPSRSKERFIDWFRKWAQPKFTGRIGKNREPSVFISADDGYQLRCSLIHSGSTDIEQGKGSALDQFIFCDTTIGMHLNRFETTVNGVKQNFLVLRVKEFSEAIFDAVDEWDAAIEEDPDVRAEKQKLLEIKSGSFGFGSW